MKALRRNRSLASVTMALSATAIFQAAGAANIRGWVVGNCDAENPTILCTTNGADWFRQGLGYVPRVGLNSVAVSPSGGNVWIAGATQGGYAAIYHSADAGATWSRQGNSAMLPDRDLFKIRAAGERAVWGVGPDGTVVLTADGGATWKTVAIPGFSGHLQAVTALDENTAWVGGAIDNTNAALFHTVDGGATWTKQVRGGITNVAHVLGLHAVDSNTVWALGGPLGIIVSTNAGAWWEIKLGGASLRDGNEIHVDANGTVWAATDSAAYWSRNRGETWDSATLPEFCMGINSPDGTNVWAVSDHWSGGMIYRSPDAGATWTQQLTLAGAGCADVAFAPLLARPRGDDFNGDGKSDLAVFGFDSGAWFIASPSLADAVDSRSPARGALAWDEHWGWPGAIIVPGDYDGDKTSDLAAFDSNTGYWYIRTLTGRVLAWAMPWTGAGLRPVPGDYDADGASDLAVYHEDQGRWYVCSLAENRVAMWNMRWGGPGLIPVAGDYDGDGADDLVLNDAANGLWYGLKAMQGPVPVQPGILFWALHFGGPGLTPVPGDYDGDGAADLAVYADGLWCAVSICGKILAFVEFGAPGMTPVSGDYDGDGADDLAVYDQARGSWYAYSVKRGKVLMWAEPWGGPGLSPVRR